MNNKNDSKQDTIIHGLGFTFIAANEKITIMVDNFGPGKAKEFCDILVSENIRNSLIIEGSGGVTLDNLSDWKSSGVDFVSSSSLNLGVSPLDFSMIFGVGNIG